MLEDDLKDFGAPLKPFLRMSCFTVQLGRPLIKYFFRKPLCLFMRDDDFEDFADTLALDPLYER